MSYNILIVGLPKSGTSALFSCITSALPTYKTCYENGLYLKDVDCIGGVICKELIDFRDKFNWYSRFYRRYSKIVIIVRDPRDRLVSAITYSAFNIIKNNSTAAYKLIDALKNKEYDPRSISCHELVELIGGCDFTIPTMGSESYLLDSISDIIRLGCPVYTIKYEDYIDGKLDNLSDYIGVELSRNYPIVSRVARSMRYGDWRHWFTDDDIRLFKPFVSDMMDRYNYNDWELAANQIIDSKFCSEFAQKCIKDGARTWNLVGDKLLY